ncbi:hypothetical protein SEA_GARDENSTATE_55 [Microbacterium phage GardenState]|uniref:Uncharacterized protein n=1 Tax=Microbacterium phage GardenState TaxID=2776841 RepID=A0A7L8ZDF9_9CAUD|nr:hypothetical protein SEA_GARDENSTATE_55 [Microbacterium phage GardenState]
MTATVTRPFSTEPMDLAAWAATADAHPDRGDVVAALMELPDWRAVPGTLWERVAEQRPTLALRRTEGYRRVRAAWKERNFARNYGMGSAKLTALAQKARA